MSSLSRDALARLVAAHLPQQGFVNLGIGAPSHVADHLQPDSGVILHSENGILNIGPRPPQGEEDWDLINASKIPITARPGCSYFDSSLSFAMMRGGHIDVAILGAFQVSQSGDLANWSTGERNGSVPGIGGAIDLAVGAKSIWVMMEHTTRDKAPRIVDRCTYPLTAAGVVSRIFTDLAIIDITPDGLVVDALLESASIETLKVVTAAPLIASGSMRTIGLDGTIGGI
ncbi:3-oxoacid CoA-transferase subunit B [Bradyrhizobium sp. dw_78]|uniref:3-oxoacid CoA-transferase subunit B n=1 Tax=Bradyrhizobium sp. dw_78 TaxID=2719793 RepID=UPI001BD5395C|nr:3-oxoacid CoA-transferase subunit B [Bradyrhizobium sp. dw_78]